MALYSNVGWFARKTKYKRMTMGLESSGIKITTGFIKTKLPQEVKGTHENHVSVLYTKVNNKNTPKYNKSIKSPGPRCNNCNQYDHIGNFCNLKKNKNDDSKDYVAVFSATQEPMDNLSWIVDSGAFMTHDKCF